MKDGILEEAVEEMVIDIGDDSDDSDYDSEDEQDFMAEDDRQLIDRALRETSDSASQ